LERTGAEKTVGSNLKPQPTDRAAHSVDGGVSGVAGPVVRSSPYRLDSGECVAGCILPNAIEDRGGQGGLSPVAVGRRDKLDVVDPDL
jgi:hypothetical protein